MNDYPLYRRATLARVPSLFPHPIHSPYFSASLFSLTTNISSWISINLWMISSSTSGRRIPPVVLVKAENALPSFHTRSVHPSPRILLLDGPHSVHHRAQRKTRGCMMLTKVLAVVGGVLEVQVYRPRLLPGRERLSRVSHPGLRWWDCITKSLRRISRYVPASSTRVLDHGLILF